MTFLLLVPESHVMDGFLPMLVLFVIGLALGLKIGLDHNRIPETQDGDSAPNAGNAAAQAPPAAPKNPNTEASERARRERIRRAAAVAQEAFDAAPLPRDLDLAPSFVDLVGLLRDPEVTKDDLLGFLASGVSALSCAAAQACAERADFDGAEPRIRSAIHYNAPFLRAYLLRVIRRDTSVTTTTWVLTSLHNGWFNAMDADSICTFLRNGQQVGEIPKDEAAKLIELESHLKAWLRPLLESEGSPLCRSLLAILGATATATVEFPREQLAEFVRFHDEKDLADGASLTPTQATALADLRQAMQRTPARSSLLVGVAGVGKSTICSELTAQLLREGWTVLSARASQIVAGQVYVGMLEQRMGKLLDALATNPKSLWIAEDFVDFVASGRTFASHASLLDQILPYIERGDVRILAPLAPDAWEELLRTAPQLRSVFTSVRIAASPSDEAIEVARHWMARRRTSEHEPLLCDDPLLGELLQRAQQHMPAQSLPGSLMRLLTLVSERIAATGERRAAKLEDGIATLSAVTGLPAAVLDERDPLDLDTLRTAFRARVVGQPEAVECLVERIAMLKAGLCDPRRPIGVFLFTGPTGTGKTEICRALAEYLFGNADRMLRLDMSEFQHPESIARLTGDGAQFGGAKALVHSIREQPFQVVLLDEIEKAHPLVFDLFLQVFDEGRMTDRRGSLADFRHAILIATSNVGVRNMEGSGLGFGGSQPDVQQALEQVFRREFLNRIDRIVVFRALGEETLRQVLHKELALVLQRRGLRRRPWAVEWDESALQFLLREGYSPTLGARPLRRAIERHVLAPLSAAIVGEDAPQGDQFLFVKSNGRGIQVSFVSPDAAPPAPPSDLAIADLDLRTLAREANGTRTEAVQLQARIAALEAAVASESWRGRRARAFGAMEEKDFWSSPDRHAALSTIEISDRVEKAVRIGAERAIHLVEAKAEPSAEELRSLAARAMLIDLCMHALANSLPQDSYVQVQAAHDPHGDPARTTDFAKELTNAYRAWATLRGMDWTELHSDGSTIVASVGGFGAHAILAHENGLHVLEPSNDEGKLVRVRVTVAPQPLHPAAAGDELGMAQRALAARATEIPTVVRRYCRGPSPEIRDRVRGWRTGRWDRVMGGEFDVMD